MRCAAILGDVERDLGAEAVARDGSGRVVEAYPDAALRRWLPAEWLQGRESYKGVAAEERRERLVSALLADLGATFRIAAEPEDRGLARSEGWIHLPLGGLAALV
jgi:hypothetical protein